MFNLTDMNDYDSKRTLVYKFNSEVQVMDCFYEIYINNLRTDGPTEGSEWNNSHCITSRMNYLQQQDAKRKHHPPSMTPGLGQMSCVTTYWTWICS